MSYYKCIKCGVPGIISDPFPGVERFANPCLDCFKRMGLDEKDVTIAAILEETGRISRLYNKPLSPFGLFEDE